MPVRMLFDRGFLIVDINKYPKVQLKGDRWVEIETENSTLRLYFDGADVMWIQHKLRDNKISYINTTSSFIREMDAEITIQKSPFICVKKMNMTDSSIEMSRPVLFDGEFLIVEINKYPKVKLKGEGWVEMEGENSILRLYFDGADIGRIEHRLHDAKISVIDTTNSIIKEKDAEIFIRLYREDI